MKITNINLRALATLVMAAMMTLGAMAAERNDSIRVLWIGNSFTFFNDLPKMVAGIADSQGIPMSCTEVLKGGERLKGHLENPRLHKLLAEGGWDFVVIQEQSSIPSYSTESVAREVYPYAATIDSLAHTASPDVNVIFYMTWGHRDGNIRPLAGYPLCDTYEGMQERLKTSYLEMTYKADARCAPAGMAWEKVREERPDLVLYNDDKFHPSATGTYLNAVTIFTTMFPRPWVSTFTGPLSPADADYLQKAGEATVLDNLRLLNIKP